MRNALITLAFFAFGTATTAEATPLEFTVTGPGASYYSSLYGLDGSFVWDSDTQTMTHIDLHQTAWYTGYGYGYGYYGYYGSGSAYSAWSMDDDAWRGDTFYTYPGAYYSIVSDPWASTDPNFPDASMWVYFWNTSYYYGSYYSLDTAAYNFENYGTSGAWLLYTAYICEDNGGADCYLDGGVVDYVTDTGYYADWIWVTIDFADSDGDGVLDDDDLCAETDLSGPVPTSSLSNGAMGDSSVIYGCNASQILECVPGNNNGQVKKGLSPGNQDVFMDMTGWAKDSDGNGTPDCLE